MWLMNYETIEASKMISKGFEAKQEGGDEPANNGKSSKTAPAASSSSSRQWAGLRNPRIVRVSRTFGGKDRHSKVCTVRGLRDRRIRLSVPTAIQLYDLQERLDLNQPSKVIDWLLDVTKQDIDKLPPLQMLPGFGQLHQQMLLAHHGQTNFTYTTTSSQPSLPPFFDANLVAADDQEDHQADVMMRARSKEVEKGKWVKGSHEQGTAAVGDFFSSAAGHRFFPANTGYTTSMLPAGNLNMTSNYHHLDPSITTLSLSQFGTHGFLPPHHQAGHEINYLNHLQAAAAPSSIPAAPPPHHFLFYPPSSMPSLFTSQQYFLPNNSLSNLTYNNRPFSLNNQGPPEEDTSS